MKTGAKPRVFISYTWLTENNHRVADKRAFHLAERLRGVGQVCKFAQGSTLYHTAILLLYFFTLIHSWLFVFTSFSFSVIIKIIYSLKLA